ncbi:MAG TPA: hypothetical protein VNE41_04995 [Chitinophagaceae bacterium]|nr:hypothetical protein [Chitinophagaceae bacterium]
MPAQARGNQMTADSGRIIGLMISKGIIGENPNQVWQNEKFVPSTMMRNNSRVAQVTDMAVSSDPYTQGEVM